MFLGEVVDLRVIGGTTLVIAGIALANSTGAKRFPKLLALARGAGLKRDERRVEEELARLCRD